MTLIQNHRIVILNVIKLYIYKIHKKQEDDVLA